MPTFQQKGLRVDYADDGQGPPVLLVHSSASSHRQWRKLVDRLRPRWRVIAPNLRGAGETTAWRAQRPQTLADAAEVVLALVDGLHLRAPLRMVGHSFGAAVVLQAAQVLGTRVAKLVLCEPMLPGLLQARGHREAAAETQRLHRQLARLGGAGDWLAAAEPFVEYFSGDGAWAAMPAERRRQIADSLPHNLHEWEAAMALQRADAFDGVTAQGLLMQGHATRRALAEMADVLHARFGHWQRVGVAGGHMAPVTHADAVNRLIADFLDDAPARAADAALVFSAV